MHTRLLIACENLALSAWLTRWRTSAESRRPAQLSFEDLALLVDREVLERDNKRLEAGLRFCRPARGDGRCSRMLKSLARVQLLILDDWG